MCSTKKRWRSDQAHRDRTALHLAAEAGHAEVVNVLVQHSNFDFLNTDRRGRTAADAAKDWRHDDIAALIEAKSKGSFTVRI